MYAQLKKARENKSQAVTNFVTEAKDNMRQGYGVVDSCPRSILQKKLAQNLFLIN